jgi:hypothetical protein
VVHVVLRLSRILPKCANMPTVFNTYWQIIINIMPTNQNNELVKNVNVIEY